MQVLEDQRPSHGHHGRHSRQGRHAALPLPGTAPAAPVAQTGGFRPGHPPSPARGVVGCVPDVGRSGR